MELQPNDIVIIYNSDHIKDRETIAYAKSMNHRKLRAIDINIIPLTEMQLKQVISHAKISAEEIIDKSSDVYQNFFKNSDLSEEDILKAVIKNSKMMKTPIALYKHKGAFIRTPKDLINQNNIQPNFVREIELEFQEK